MLIAGMLLPLNEVWSQRKSLPSYTAFASYVVLTGQVSSQPVYIIILCECCFGFSSPSL